MTLNDDLERMVVGPNACGNGADFRPSFRVVSP